MAIALPRRNTEQLCFIFSPITLVFSLLFRSVGYGKPSLSCKLIIYITLKVFFFSLGTVIFFNFFFFCNNFIAALDSNRGYMKEVESRVRDLLLAVDTDHYTLPQRKSEMVREVMFMVHVYWLKVSVK